LEDIAATFDLGIERIIQILKKAGMGETPRKRGQKPWDDRNKAVVAAYRAGRTMQSVADEFGITRERVRQIVTRNGGAFYKANSHKHGDVTKVCRYCGNEFTVAYKFRNIRPWHCGMECAGMARRKVTSSIEAIELYCSGLGFVEVGKRIGLSTMAVYRRVKRERPDIIRSSGPKPKRWQVAAE
jgi:predicted transcriptional regulator